ncbi:diadenylate cyclase CdaA [Lachnoclostridium sp. An181]|uniref:diadenylate cyclase CdaA n=1 Tax=Lachnoclostridium sp. An181 TaxID=1965575 RepID=UPI0026D5BBA2|nr:diadenylate cyclase CdaA [Lachnoclostridium sp. An181]
MWHNMIDEIKEGLWGLSIPTIRITDIIEIFIIAVIVYKILVWIKNTKAWMLLKGIIALAVFILIAALFKMNTILWIAENSISVLAIAAVVVFQPELRRALEKLGEQNLISNIIPFGQQKESERFGNETIDAIVSACYSMGKVKTGALIVVEQAIMLTEYETTGIQLDAKVSSQLLINIFEHNTPLHDGAVIIRGDRVVAATCYLPLSENMSLSKALGTRHRAAVGMSEVSDALVIVVSEETGKVSTAFGGRLVTDVTPEYLTERLINVQNKTVDTKRFVLWKGRQRHGQKHER